MDWITHLTFHWCLSWCTCCLNFPSSEEFWWMSEWRPGRRRLPRRVQSAVRSPLQQFLELEQRDVSNNSFRIATMPMPMGELLSHRNFPPNFFFEWKPFLPAAQRHGHKEGGVGVGVGTFRSCSLFTSCLRHGLLEGGIGMLLGHLSPVPFILNGKPQSLN